MRTQSRKNEEHSQKIKSENNLRKELFQIKDEEDKSIKALTNAASALRLEWRAQNFSSLKNNLERQKQKEENKRYKRDPVRENDIRRTTYWTYKAAKVAATPKGKCSPKPKLMGFSKSPRIDTTGGGKRRPKTVEYRDVYTERIIKELKTKPLRIEMIGKCKYPVDEIREKIKDMNFDQFNDGSLALAARRFQKNQRDCI